MALAFRHSHLTLHAATTVTTSTVFDLLDPLHHASKLIHRSPPRLTAAPMAALLVPDGLAFYAVAAAACALNVAAIGAVARGYVRSTPLFHTLVLLLSWALYQCAFRVFTDREAANVAASPWAPPCGFCPRSLGFDPGENSRICTGFIGSVERWMLLPWQFLPWSGGSRGNGSASAAAGERDAHLTGEVFVWWPTFAGCIIGFAVGAFADGVRRVMRWMGLRVRRRFRRWAHRA